MMPPIRQVDGLLMMPLRQLMLMMPADYAMLIDDC